MRYGKIINGKIEFAKNPLWFGNTMVSNPTEKHYKELGYLPIITQPIPQKDGYYYEPYYVEVDNSIYQFWTEKVADLLI